MDDEDLISVAEAAEILRVHPDTVRRLYDAGELTGRKTKAGRGGWRRIWRASVEAYERQQRGESAGDAGT